MSIYIFMCDKYAQYIIIDILAKMSILFKTTEGIKMNTGITIATLLIAVAGFTAWLYFFIYVMGII